MNNLTQSTHPLALKKALNVALNFGSFIAPHHLFSSNTNLANDMRAYDSQKLKVV